MFYVEFPSVESWEKDKRSRYEEFVKKMGIRPDTILPVIEGMVKGRECAFSYLRYADLFRQVPTYKGILYESPTRAGRTVKLDLCLENGLLLKSCIQADLLLDPRKLSEKEGEGYLLLCRWEGNIFQVIAPVHDMLLNMIREKEAK